VVSPLFVNQPSTSCSFITTMFANETVAPSYFEQTYGNTDFSQLTWLELKWVAWYIGFGNTVIATGMMSFLMHEAVYFGRSIPWIIVDAIPYFRRWKLQPTKVPTAKEQWECTKLVLISHFAMEMTLIVLFEPLARMVGMATWQVPLPSFRTMLPQLAFCFVYEDLFHYLAHQLLHTPTLYKHIHKLHHKYSAPFGLAAEYAHPLETAILGMGTISAPLIYCFVMRDVHILTVYVWVSLRLFQAIDAHSGYHFPWSLHNFIPFWSGADHHDFHHMAFTNNYATSFRWWDRICGTDDKYRAYKKRLAAAKAALKNGSKEKEKALEQKMLDEVVKEGLKAEAEIEHAAKAKVL